MANAMPSNILHNICGVTGRRLWLKPPWTRISEDPFVMKLFAAWIASPLKLQLTQCLRELAAIPTPFVMHHQEPALVRQEPAVARQEPGTK